MKGTKRCRGLCPNTSRKESFPNVCMTPISQGRARSRERLRRTGERCRRGDRWRLGDRGMRINKAVEMFTEDKK